MNIYKLILVKLLLLFSSNLYAQFNWGCYDSLLVNHGAFCIPDYEPVCACNRETYRNHCYARNEGYQQFYDGICEELDFNIRFNPVAYNLELDIITRDGSDVIMHIFDWFGKIYYHDYYPGVRRKNVMLNVSGYDQGLYIIVMRGHSEVVVKKFVKVDR